MAKDPAFLFYYQDFLVGTDHMTDEQIGQYVKCLCHQANRGAIREEHMKNICKTHENHMIIMEKFTKDENGELFNNRLKEEATKRSNYTESRRNNRKNPNICRTYEKHMENENENEDVIETVKEIVEDLNKVCNTSYKHSSAKTRVLIKARLNDGFTVKDFKTVHMKKAQEWRSNSEMVKFLRPETLYGNKFEGYLQQKEVKNLTKAQAATLRSIESL